MRFTDLETQAPGRPSRSTTPPTEWPGPTTTPPSSSCGSTRPCVPISSGATGSGTDPATDVLVYEEPDDRFYLGVGRTKDDRFVLMGLDSKVTSEVRALQADDPLGTFSVIEPRRQGIEYSVDHDRGDPAAGGTSRFLIVTNDGAEDFRLMEAPDDSPRPSHWKEVIAGRPGSAARQRGPVRRPPGGLRAGGGRDPDQGHRRRHRRRPRRSTSRSPPPPSGVGPTPSTTRPPCATSTRPWSPPGPSSTSTSGPATPCSSKRQPVLGDFDPGRYRTERLWAPGRRRHRGPDLPGLPARPGHGRRPAMQRRRGGRPCLLYGYGSYEASMDPDLLVAPAEPARPGIRLRHRPRPGRRGDGPALVRAGKAGGQAQHLHRLRGLCPHPDRPRVDVARPAGGPGGQRRGPVDGRGGQPGPRPVPGRRGRGALRRLPDHHSGRDASRSPCSSGRSGATRSRTPGIYAGHEVVLALRQRSVRRRRRAIRSATRTSWPPAGLSDPRVGFWEPAKWVAKLRAANPENRVLLKTELGAGHGGPSGRYDAWKDEAFVYAFILDALGLVEGAGGSRAGRRRADPRLIHVRAVGDPGGRRQGLDPAAVVDRGDGCRGRGGRGRGARGGRLEGGYERRVHRHGQDHGHVVEGQRGRRGPQLHRDDAGGLDDLGAPAWSVPVHKVDPVAAGRGQDPARSRRTDRHERRSWRPTG